MAGKEGLRPEEMGFARRSADKLIGVGNVIDGVTIGVGILMVSAPVVAFGVLGLMSGKIIRENYIRRK